MGKLTSTGVEQRIIDAMKKTADIPETNLSWRVSLKALDMFQMTTIYASYKKIYIEDRGVWWMGTIWNIPIYLDYSLGQGVALLSDKNGEVSVTLQFDNGD